MPGFIRQARRRLRRHWLIAALLTARRRRAGLVLFAYRPALIFPDSLRYLQFAQRFAERPLVARHDPPERLLHPPHPAAALHALVLIPLAQHALGLAEGAMIYAVLTHRAAAAGWPRWRPSRCCSTHYSSTWSSTSSAMYAPRFSCSPRWSRWCGTGTGPARAAMAAAGLLLGAAAVIRVADLVLIVPAAALPHGHRAAVAAAGRGGGILAGCFLLPVAGYAGWFALPTGSGASPVTTGRSSTAGWFSSPTVPGCGYRPTSGRCAPPSLRRSATTTSTCGRRSPRSGSFRRRHGMTRQAVVLDFSRRVLAHQPLSYLAAVGTDAATGSPRSAGTAPSITRPPT